MYLTKIGENVDETNTNVEFEKVADDLIMISVNNDINDNTRVLSYWRLLGNGHNPPLEIGVNDIGIIKSITMFLDKDCFKECKLLRKNMSYGNVLVDLSIFRKANDYVDVKGNYYVTLADDKFICNFNEEYDLKETVVNKNIQFYIDNNNRLQGIVVSNLTDAEIKMIKSLM